MVEGGKEKEGTPLEKNETEEHTESECERRARKALPQIDFSTFVLSLASSVMIHLGEIEDPDQKQAIVSLPMAKQTLNILALLQEKTRGNLEDDEDRLLTELLYDLRMKFVRACKEQSGEG